MTSDWRITALEDYGRPQLLELLVDLADSEQEHFDHPRESRQELAQRLAPQHNFVGENHIWVAERGAGELLGLCWAVLFDPGNGLEAEIAELYVAPDSRGQGVATALLQPAMRLFRERGVTFASVWTRANNPAALSAYRAAGFTDTEQTVLTWLPLDDLE